MKAKGMSKTARRLIPPEMWTGEMDEDSFGAAIYAKTFGALASRSRFGWIDEEGVRGVLDKHGFVTELIAESRVDTLKVFSEDGRVLVNFDRRAIALLTGSSESRTLLLLHDNLHCPIEDLIKELDGFRKQMAENKEAILRLVVAGPHGLTLKSVQITPRHIDLALHYGDQFEATTHNGIAGVLTNTGTTGLIMLHGAPGTGKTNYLRMLLTMFPHRQMLYVPSHLASSISDPGFLDFMISHGSGSVLLIEDAESIVQERTGESNSAVSNLLNLTDGLLGDALKCQVVTTFNVERTKIDPALLREGRLLVEHHFGPLSPDDSDRLLKHLGKPELHKTMTLAEIYNVPPVRTEKEERIVGFAS